MWPAQLESMGHGTPYTVKRAAGISPAASGSTGRNSRITPHMRVAGKGRPDRGGMARPKPEAES
jgi:hypothetical protein